LTPSADYLIFKSLLQSARVALTDAGGVQTECVLYKTPCLTLRNENESPATIKYGLNKIIGTETHDIISHGLDYSERAWEIRNKIETPPLWDNKVAERIIDIIEKNFCQMSIT